MKVSVQNFTPPEKVMKVLLAIAGICFLVSLVGFFASAERAWGGYLMGFSYFASLSIVGAFFICVLTLANGRWSTALRRVPEAMTAGLPLALALGIVLVIGLFVNGIYPWTDPDVVVGNHLLEGKTPFLNRPFFAVRLVVIFLLWMWLARGMVRASRNQDGNGDRSWSRMRLRYALGFLPVFAITYSLASIDWLQSVEPEWFSTMYGLITLSGAGTSGLAVCMILAVKLRQHTEMSKVIKDDHFDDLGKIGIGFALFWGYIWFCQYMLIWYTNMPEETFYYQTRLHGAWKGWTYMGVILNWAVPFFVLMPKSFRRSGRVLVFAGIVMLIGQGLNMINLIGPGLMGDQPSIGPWEVAPIIGACALFFWITLRGLGQANLIPDGDPHLEESLHHHC